MVHRQHKSVLLHFNTDLKITTGYCNRAYHQLNLQMTVMLVNSPIDSKTLQKNLIDKGPMNYHHQDTYKNSASRYDGLETKLK